MLCAHQFQTGVRCLTQPHINQSEHHVTIKIANIIVYNSVKAGNSSHDQNSFLLNVIIKMATGTFTDNS